jgi:hypothetical protein
MMQNIKNIFKSGNQFKQTICYKIVILYEKEYY